MENVFVVVPARGGSKGLIGKNSMEVRKKTITVRSIVHARHITSDENIILSTDSKKIASEVADFFKIKYCFFFLFLNVSKNALINKLTFFLSSPKSPATQCPTNK